MIRLTDSIAPTYGNLEDIAPVQVLLARAKHRIRPFWRGEIDGAMTPALRTAIEMFQYESGILAAPLIEDPGWIHPDGPTITALKGAVSVGLLRMRVLPGTAEVFMTQRSSRILESELDRVREIVGSSDPCLSEEIVTLMEVCHARLCLQLSIIDRGCIAGSQGVRVGIRGLSVPLPGGVFHTIPSTNPWMVPEAFWHAVQGVVGDQWRFPPSDFHGRGWLTPMRARQAAA